jgi:UDPglucose 6-dehydrogenase
MVKYVANCFLAVKVSFANEMSQICEAMTLKGVLCEYDDIIEMAVLDKRLGETHWQTPGPDGKKGFGGSCFPKDINAMICAAKNSNVQPDVLEAAWRKNLEVRPERDWEKLKGRAVV